MTKNKKNEEDEGIVIDVVPEPEETIEDEPPAPEDEQASAEPVATVRKPRSTLPSLFLAILALILIAASTIVGMQLQSGMNQDIKQLENQLKTLQGVQENLQASIESASTAITAQQDSMAQQRTDVAAQQSSLEQQIQGISNERRQMKLREAELKALVADIHKRVGRTDSQWRVAEAEYLIRLGINRLQLARDVDTARAALELADARLRDTAEPQWDPIRQQLAKDITALNAVTLPDTAGISAKLSALAEQVPALALTSPRTQATIDAQQPVAADRESRSWKTLTDDMLRGIKDSVRIRRSDEPVHALLTPDQQHFLYQNLALQLQTARLALVQGNAAAYQATLDRAKAWINDLFDLGKPSSTNMLVAIDELMAIDISPPLPDITGALSLLKERQLVDKALSQDIP